MRSYTAKKIVESDTDFEFAFARTPRAAVKPRGRKQSLPPAQVITNQDYIEQMESRHWETLGDFA